ncbi:DUF4148 domain-containing protein [Paraburkholderia silvatlantica]|uniref:Uncharacterized protein DUF4148 n=1 Tax=Paraburkholderia silvatlantica TaxID=321895 RepID=A0A2V4V0F2_9BURK|nr:DUF4148 domain-containing protein [Paraburkholderia silvatlantica]PYE26266.1 uncharacterized protein DUF4148 [Paraburkholderia silvatlantica]TDQ93153.1 uncharacterized protein DUF4148 [Paraburkholderia silvatlantica]
MKKSATFSALLVSAVTALVTAPAFAGADATTPAVQSLPVAAVATNGPKTRAEVRAELASARAHGELSLDPNSPAYPQQYAMGGYTAPREQAGSFFRARNVAN